MKVTYLERVESRMAFSRKKYCPVCGGHEYKVIEVLEPALDEPWYIQCAQCEYTGESAPTRDIAMMRWETL